MKGYWALWEPLARRLTSVPEVDCSNFLPGRDHKVWSSPSIHVLDQVAFSGSVAVGRFAGGNGKSLVIRVCACMPPICCLCL